MIKNCPKCNSHRTTPDPYDTDYNYCWQCFTTFFVGSIPNEVVKQQGRRMIVPLP